MSYYSRSCIFVDEILCLCDNVIALTGDVSMIKDKKLKYLIGTASMVLAVALIVFICFVVMSTAKSDINLAPSPDNNNGWSYEVLANGKNQSTQPDFIDEYTLSFPQSDISAIRIKRVMTETQEGSYILLYPYGVGTEVFLDNKLLFSNIPFSEHNEDGYLELSENYLGRSGEIPETVYVSLPEDYSGKTLSITSYFLEDEEFISPAFPLLETDETFYSAMVTSAFLPNVVITVCAIMALMLCAVFLFGIHYGRADYKILLLILFFVMLFANTVYTTGIGSSSRLTELLNLSFLEGLYITPLFVYIALCLKKWRRYVLLSCAGVQFAYYCCSLLLHQLNNELIVVDDNYISVFMVFVISLVMIIAEIVCNRDNAKKYITPKNVVTLVCVIIIAVIGRAYTDDGNIIMYLGNVFSSLRFPYFAGLVHLLSSIYSLMAVVTLISDFISGVINDKKNMAVIGERYRLAVSNYKMLLKSEDETKRARHEMSHHIKAISVFLSENKIEEANNYIASISYNLNSLPALRYCKNLLVNAIVGACVEQAQAEGINIEYNINVDEIIAMNDSDLSVLIENMLDNALEACRKVKSDREKYIRININQDDNFLFVGCVNSFDGKIAFDENGDIITSKEEYDNHGYGISAMKIVAEKYNSILKIESTENEFSVMTNLNLK